MSVVEDPLKIETVEDEPDEFSALSRKPPQSTEPAAIVQPGVLTARFHGFGLDERPLLTGVPGLAGEIVFARTTVPLLRDQIGSTVVVLCEQQDPRRPIIVGVLQDSCSASKEANNPVELVSVQVDDDRLVLTAEREIVLRCGNASITLTRAGKVLIKGSYVLSRSSGHNKIKGAAIDIN